MARFRRRSFRRGVSPRRFWKNRRGRAMRGRIGFRF